MAVKKNAAEAAGSEKAAGAEDSIIETEKTGNGANMRPQTANRETGTVKLIYIGPSLPKAMLKSNRIFEGTRGEIRKELETVLEKFPLAEKLLVPVAELAEKKDKVKTAGNILNKYYSDIASAVSVMKKEG